MPLVDRSVGYVDVIMQHSHDKGHHVLRADETDGVVRVLLAAIPFS